MSEKFNTLEQNSSKPTENIPSLENNSEFIQLIRAFPLGSQIELVQLINNLRPVAEITVIPKFKDKLEPAIQTLKEKAFAVTGNERSGGIIEYYVSKDPQLVQEVINIQNRTNGPTDHKRFGELMGFPPGSIEAFIKNDKSDYLGDDEIEKHLGFTNHLFQLQLSRTHLDESIQYLKDSYKVVLEQAPHIIEEILPREENAEEYKKKIAQFVYS